MLGGVFFWAWFLNFGRLAFNALDWDKEYRYLATLQYAIRSMRIPFHAIEPYRGIDRFLGIPETCLSPQVLLLAILDVRTFLVVNLCLLYLVGIWGSVRLARRLQLGPVALAFWLLLFNFNGYIVSHLAVGHTTWAACLLLPWLFEGLLDALEPGPMVQNVAQIGLVLWAILLQGAFHLFVWCAIMLVLVAIVKRRSATRILLGLGLGAALGVSRLAPAAVAFEDVRPEFWSGYPSLALMLEAFTVSHGPQTPFHGGLGWWEYDFYCSWLGWWSAMALSTGALVLWRSDFHGSGVRWLVSPASVLAALSYGSSYTQLRALGLPLISAERVTSRLMFLPMAVVLLLAATSLDWCLRRTEKIYVRLLVGGGILGFVTVRLIDHAKLWSLASIAAMGTPSVQLTTGLIERPDPFYKAVVIGSYVTTASVALILVMLVRHVRPRENR